MADIFTPGPWQVSGKTENLQIRVEDEEGSWICNVWGQNGEAESNARLIAAAPELLVAVERARRHAENIGITDGSYIAQLDAAIRKARGA